MVEVRGAEVSALAVTIGLIIGVGVAFLLQALP
jgi:capsular polysaccharide biosynthesis protein